MYQTRGAPKLGSADHDFFRTYVAKLLYVAKRVKPEMLTAVAFLTTRAVAPDTDDMAKLQRALGYLRGDADRGIVLRSSTAPARLRSPATAGSRPAWRRTRRRSLPSRTR